MNLFTRSSNLTPRNSSLRRSRTATIRLISSVVVLVIAVAAYNLLQQYRVVEETAVQTARGTANAAESHAAQTFGETYRIIGGVADVYRQELEHMRLQGGPVNEAYLHNIMAEKLTRAPAVVSFFILDEGFRGVAESRTLPVDMSRVTLTGMSLDAITDIGGDLILGELYKNARGTAPSEAWMLPVGVEVNDEAGELRALRVRGTTGAIFFGLL